ncbi:MAG TPA: hypothetical protein V6D00_00095 [Pantanalinema sp.]
MADKDIYRQNVEPAKEDVVEFESELPQQKHGVFEKAKGALEGLVDRAKEAVQDIKEHNK